LQVVWYP